GLGPVSCILLGMLTGIGRGMLRDILVARIPMVLRAELYAIAALAGAAAAVMGVHLELPRPPVIVAGALACFTLGFMVFRCGWRVPVAADRATEAPRDGRQRWCPGPPVQHHSVGPFTVGMSLGIGRRGRRCAMPSRSRNRMPGGPLKPSSLISRALTTS